ncbi:MAG: deoxyribodipyrimidine photo-lyase, partial [Flavobacteriaceae bacterium]
MQEKVSIFWFRRDLRLEDNAGLYAALRGDVAVLPIFIFDSEILERLPKDDARLSFIFETLQKMRAELQQKHGSSLALYYGKPADVFEDLCKSYDLHTVHTNRDYEPYARERDEKIARLLSAKNISYKTYKDQVVFERNEVVKDDGDPYVVYTPYK